MSMILDPHEIISYALEHSKLGRQSLKQEIKNAFMVHDNTVDKWASPNESSKRRNPIGSCAKLFTILWNSCRPAAFQIQALLRELELKMETSPKPPPKEFDALELIQELRKATHIAEQLQAKRCLPAAYTDLLSEVKAIGSEFMDRALIATPLTPSVAPLRYNANTPEAYR